MTKTNAMRMLDRAKIKYDVLKYDYDESDLSGVHAAAALSLDPNQVFKTLVTRGGKNGLFVFCIPVGAELDLKKCAKCAGVKSLEMIHVKELISLTGYMRGGCSPIGMKKQYKTFIDISAQSKDTIMVSAGKIGYQVELDPNALADMVRAKFADLVSENE